eukprot:14929993-Alexandrium_andersonii.AAC.1
MSASLVGSEMCIRDSCSRRRWDSVRMDGRLRAEHQCPELVRVCGRCSVCLLYTSDAADDM